MPIGLVLASCSSTDDTSNNDSSAAQHANDGATTDHDLEQSQSANNSAGDISQSPEIGTRYRESLETVQTENLAVATADPVATDAVITA